MRRAEYTDETGRQWATMLPDGAEDEAAEVGIPLGPPDTSDLGLPEDVAVRLHNQLFARGLLERKDLKGRTQELFAALQAAYRLDVVRLGSLYI